MAVSRRDPLRTFRPRWPERGGVDSERVVFTYDRPSDTLFVDFTGTARPAVSVPIDSDFAEVDIYLRVDPISEEVVGLQIEGVVAAVDRPTWLGDALVVANPAGPDTDGMGAVRGGTKIGKGEVVDALFDAFIPVAA